MGRALLSIVAVVIGSLTPSFATAQSQRTWIIDFEGLATSDSTPTRLTDQYAKPPYSTYGVTFSIANFAARSPVIAVEGAPRRAFGTDDGADDPKFPSGSCAMTRPVNAQNATIAGDIKMSFDPPVTSVSFYISDIDGQESFTVRSFSGATELTSLQKVLNASSQYAGDGKHTLVRITPTTGQTIDSVILDTPDATQGYAVDFLTFTRSCGSTNVKCPRTPIRISQESAANAGDFASNVRGFVSYFLSDTDLESLYAYGVPDDYSYNGPQVEPVKDRVHSFLVTTTDQQPALINFYDRPGLTGGNGGGKAEMIVRFDGGRGSRCANLAWGVQDDPAGAEDLYFRLDACSFGTRHDWASANSDGYSIKGFDPTARAFLSFDNSDGNASNKVIDSLTEWYWYTPTGSPIKLDLVQGRRVRLDLVPPCAADFNLDAFLTFEDFDLFVDAFASGDEIGDFDKDGFITFEDFDAFVAAFEEGC